MTDAEANDPQGSPEEPLADLLPPLREAMVGRGYTDLTPVQRAVLEGAARGENLRISSQTGSGKTVAIGIALAPELIEAVATHDRRAGPRALIVAPTRELAQQVQRELGWLYAKIKGLHVAVCTGGTDIGRERRFLAKKPALLVGTPGRLLDHIRAGALDLSQLTHVALDEADQMLDMGFKDELDAIVDALPESRSSYLVSATFPREVRRFADRFAPDAIPLEGTRLGEANADIDHQIFMVRERDRYAALVNNLLTLYGGRVLVFVKRRQDAAELAERLAGDGFSALPFSGDLPQGQRNRTLSAFRRGVVQILVATDVAARGIDVADIAAVVHDELPFDADTYTHRSGRTGRAGSKGRSIVLAPPRSERRVQRLLADANLEATWPSIPTADKIRKAVTKRARRKLHARMTELLPLMESGEALAEAAQAAQVASEGEAQDQAQDQVQTQVQAPATVEDIDSPPDAATLEYAAELLARYDPRVLVAELLKRTEGELPCDPIELEAPVVRRDGKSDAPRERRPAYTGDYEAFKINWGEAKGATPSRIVAHLCRRTGINSSVIGAMDIQRRETFFEIASNTAEKFAELGAEKDERDPHLHIERSDTPVSKTRRPRGRDDRPRRPFGGKGGGKFSKGGPPRGEGGGDRDERPRERGPRGEGRSFDKKGGPPRGRGGGRKY